MKRMLFAALLLWPVCLEAQDTSWRVDTSDPTKNAFLFVTERGGIAKGLAHNHVIFAKTAQVTLSTPAAGPVEQGHFSLTISANDLEIDNPAVTKTWFPGIQAAGILEDEPGEVSESDRKKIRDAALAEDQLDAAKFPTISAEIVSLTAKPQKVGKLEMTHEAVVRITFHGKTVERAAPAKVVQTGDTLAVEAVAPIKFTEFGIKPVSLMLGAIQNKDDVHLYINFKATRG